jgi:hypothetical protein
MPEKIQVNEDLGIVELESSGKVTKQEMVESISQLREIFDKQGIYKVLVDATRQDKMPSTFDIYELFSTYPREIRLAVLIQLSQATADDITFGETVGVNRGVRMKTFCEKKQALKWLDNG